jgi:glyoxylase-like metal-dependent hydrolase (beta-lactamase superfamily II)
MDQPYQAGPDIWVLPTHLHAPGMGNLIINAYVLLAEQPVLIDSGIGTDSADFVAALESIVPLRDLKWIWLTHDDADHTGSIQKIVEAAPQARLATPALAAMRMSTWWPVPFDRVFALALDTKLDVGDRKLRAIRPPTFDNPMSTGIFDEKTGTLFSVDAFGAILPEVTDNAADIPEADLRQGMVMWGTSDAPWCHLVDVDRFDAVLEGVRRLAPSRILSSHLPAAGASIDQFLAIARSLRDCEPFVPPDQAQFEQMLAMMAPPPAAANLP